MEGDTIKGVLCVTGGLIVHLYLGCFYLWGNIQVYITSYLNKVDPPVSLDDTSIIFTLQTLSHGLLMFLGPFLLTYLPPWVLLFIGGIFSIGGVFVSSFITSYKLFCAVYPITFGIGLGFSYMAPIVPGWEYFPNRRGMVSGLIVFGFGVGSFIFGFISLGIANPENEEPNYSVPGGNIFAPDSPISDNAPKMIRINCAIWLALLLISLPMVRRKKIDKVDQSINEFHSDSEEKEIGMVPKLKEDQNAEELSFKQALFNPTTFQIFTLMILSSCYPYYIASNFKSFEEKDVPDDKFITIVGSVGAIFNGLSRSFWSSIQDVYGFKRVYWVLLVVEMIVAFTIISIHKIKFLYLIWVCLSFCCLGGHFSMFPTLSAKIYGSLNGGKVYGFLFLGFSTATMLNWVLSQYNSNVIYILACLPIIAMILTCFLDETPKTLKAKKVDQSFIELSENSKM